MDEHLRTSDVAAMLNVSPKTIADWRRYPGKGPRFIRLVGVIRYRRSDVEAWLLEQAESTERAS